MKIRTRIFLVFVVIMAVGIFSLVRWMQGEMRPRYMEAQEDTLVDMSQLLASIISTQGLAFDQGKAQIDTAFLSDSFAELLTRNIDAQIYQIHKQQVDIRVYVTDNQGTVIFDSDAERDLNSDYSQWRDVNRTLRGDYGARSTDFDPLYPDGSIMYIAAPVLHEGDIIGVVSVGKPTRNAERFMEHLLGNIASVGLIILLIATALGLVIHGWLSRPLLRLQQYADAVTRGERTALPSLGNNEVGQVGEAMEAMRVALDGKTYVTGYVQALTHELKSPLAAIRGASELLNEDMPEADRRRFLNHITDAVQRLQELVDRVLDLAALEYRPSLETSEPVELAGLLDDVVQSLSAVAQSRQVNLKLDVATPAAVHGDAFLLSRAISNILKNAIEFSPPQSSVALTLSESAQHVQVQVCDQGPGIPDYARERIFERFFSLARPDGRKGSGLGLSFVREIAALHGAEVTVNDNLAASTVTPGTCVRLLLPKQRQ